MLLAHCMGKVSEDKFETYQVISGPSIIGSKTTNIDSDVLFWALLVPLLFLLNKLQRAPNLHLFLHRNGNRRISYQRKLRLVETSFKRLPRKSNCFDDLDSRAPL